MSDNTISSLIEIKESSDITKKPGFKNERDISNNYGIVLSSIIVFCALVSIIINIKRKSTIRIIFSIILPIIAIIIAKILRKSVLLNQIKNGINSSNMIFIVIAISALVIILLSLIFMIFKNKKKD